METEKSLVINGLTIEKGERKQLEIVIAKLYDHTGRSDSWKRRWPCNVC